MNDLKRTSDRMRQLEVTAQKKGWLNDIHPTSKLFVTLACIILVISINQYNLPGLLGMCIYPVVLFVIGEISIKEFLYRFNKPKEDTTMVQIIAGRKGKGKTKHLLDMANNGIKAATGSIVYLDKSSKHMYELNNRIRLINVNEYPVATSQGFIGFICGIISQDHDIETMFLDSFLKLAGLEGEDISETITTLEGISEKYSVNFVLSISMDAAEMPENAQKDVVVSL